MVVAVLAPPPGFRLSRFLGPDLVRGITAGAVNG
jgi:hypothetical protein